MPPACSHSATCYKFRYSYHILQVFDYLWKNRQRTSFPFDKMMYISVSSSSSYICHGVRPLVDLFRSHLPVVSSKVYHDFFCQLGSSVSLSWVIYFEAFCLHVVSGLTCIPVICPKLVLFLIPLQFVHLFCNMSCYMAAKLGLLKQGMPEEKQQQR